MKTHTRDSLETLTFSEVKDGMEVHLLREDAPPNPRTDRSCATRIVGWARGYYVGDDDRPDTPRAFLVGIYQDEFDTLLWMDDADIHDFIRRTPYPGALWRLSEHGHDTRIFEVEPCTGDPLEMEDLQVGFVYMTPSMLADVQRSRDDCRDIIEAEVKQWQDFANGDVYVLSLVRFESTGTGDERAEILEAAGDVYLQGEDWYSDGAKDELTRLAYDHFSVVADDWNLVRRF